MNINIEKIDWIRIERGLSITQLAKRAEMSKATISRLLRKEGNARTYTIGKIALALEVSVHELLF